MTTPRQSITNLLAAAGGGGSPGRGGGGGGLAAAASASSARAGRHYCLAVQQLLLKGLAPPPPGGGDSPSSAAAAATRVLSLRVVEQLARLMERHGGGCSARLARGAGGGAAAVLGSEGQAAYLRQQQQRRAADLAPVLDQSLSVSLGRQRAGAVSSVDSDVDADAAALLGASPCHYDSLKRHVALSADGYRALLGPWSSQLAVSVLALLPTLIATINLCSSGGGVQRPDEALGEGLERAMEAVAAAAAAMGLPALAARLRDLAGWRMASWRR